MYTPLKIDGQAERPQGTGRGFVKKDPGVTTSTQLPDGTPVEVRMGLRSGLLYNPEARTGPQASVDVLFEREGLATWVAEHPATKALMLIWDIRDVANSDKVLSGATMRPALDVSEFGVAVEAPAPADTGVRRWAEPEYATMGESDGALTLECGAFGRANAAGTAIAAVWDIAALKAAMAFTAGGKLADVVRLSARVRAVRAAPTAAPAASEDEVAD